MGQPQKQVALSCALMVVVWLVQWVANPYVNPNLDALDETMFSMMAALLLIGALLLYEVISQTAAIALFSVLIFFGTVWSFMIIRAVMKGREDRLQLHEGLYQLAVDVLHALRWVLTGCKKPKAASGDGEGAESQGVLASLSEKPRRVVL